MPPRSKPPSVPPTLEDVRSHSIQHTGSAGSTEPAGRRRHRLYTSVGGLLLMGGLALILLETVQLIRQLGRLPLEAPAADQAPPDEELESWIYLDLPEDATQVERGAEIYRLVCSTCHGDRGQGLTREYLATVPVEERNCWQSKCHAANHPPDGFTLPRGIPGIVGNSLTNRFPTALDLYAFIRANMPWHAPGTMLDQEYWEVTAFVLTLNGVDLQGKALGPASAPGIHLQ